MITNTSVLKPKLYFINDVENIIRRNRLTLRRWWTSGKFPKPSLINNRLAWHAEVVSNWIIQNTKESMEVCDE